MATNAVTLSLVMPMFERVRVSATRPEPASVVEVPFGIRLDSDDEDDELDEDDFDDDLLDDDDAGDDFDDDLDDIDEDDDEDDDMEARRDTPSRVH